MALVLSPPSACALAIMRNLRAENSRLASESHASQIEAIFSAWLYTCCFSLDGSRRVEFRMKVSSDAT
jgi:hypothetical protein